GSSSAVSTRRAGMSRRSGVVRVRGVVIAAVALALALVHFLLRNASPAQASPGEIESGINAIGAIRELEPLSEAVELTAERVFEAATTENVGICEPFFEDSGSERIRDPAIEGEPRLRVLGRLFDADDQPCARQIVRVVVSVVSGCTGTSYEATCSTDGGGRFDASLEEFSSGAHNSIDVLVESERGTLIGRVRTDLGEDLGSILDLGDRIVVPAQPWCAGVVVDGSGEPVVGAKLGIFSNTSEHAFVASDAEGRFEVRGIGPCVADSMRIWTSSVGGEGTDDATFRPGDSDLRVVAQPRAALEGRITFESFVSHEQFLVELQLGDEGKLAEVDADGSFRFRALIPGRYDVVIRFFGGAREELARFDGVDVAGATVVRDARLENVDLRGRIRRVDLRVRDTAGRPLDGVVLGGGDGGTGW